MTPTRISIVAAAAICLAGGANAATTQLNDFRLDANRLASQGTQRYGISMHGRSSNDESMTFKSQVTMSTYFEDGRFVLADTWELMGSTFDFEMHCRPNATLSVEHGIITMKRHNQVSSANIEVSDEIASIEGEKSTEMAYPHGTVSQAALFRIIPQLPRDTGAEFTFNGYTEVIEMGVKTPDASDAFKIVCQGPALVDVNGNKVSCTKYTVQTDEQVDFFVDRDSQVRKVVADAGETVMVLIPDTPRAVSAECIP